jgi:hypothetical protein
VSRVIARHGLPRLAELDPITGQQLRASKKTTVRYERARPGELAHMDVKKIGRIPDPRRGLLRRPQHDPHRTRYDR